MTGRKIDGRVFMKLLYIFDGKIKPLTMTDQGYCKPTETGVLQDGIRCIRVYDVNLWFYTKNGVTIAFDSGHRNFLKSGSSLKRFI
jgi:hypothetical protein